MEENFLCTSLALKLLLLFFKMVKCMCICVLSASIPEHQAYALPKESRKGLNLLELELMVVSH